MIKPAMPLAVNAWGLNKVSEEKVEEQEEDA